MSGNRKQVSGMMVLLMVMINAIIVQGAYIFGKGHWILLITLPLLFIALYQLKKR
jgi:hypothetical protein